MSIINTVEEPKVVMVGNPNLMNLKNIAKLMINYQTPLAPEFRRSIAYYDLSLKESTGKHLKANFLQDVVDIKEYCENEGVTIIACTSPEFFKHATGQGFMYNLGKAFKGTGILDGYTIVPVLNAFMLLAQPQKIKELNLSIHTLDDVLNGNYEDEVNIIDEVDVNTLTDPNEIKEVLKKLSKAPMLTMDIETTGLLLGKDRIITIALSPNEKEAYSFPVCPEYSDDYEVIREYLDEFYLNYKGQQLWHNAMFDVPFILRDLLEIKVNDRRSTNSILNSWDILDTMHVKYLAVNGLQRTPLGLKESLMSIYGEYDSGIDQSRLLDYSYKEVGEYNCYDVTGTWEVYNKYYPKMQEDGQEEIFKNYYIPSLKTLLKFKYGGAIVNMEKLEEASVQLTELLEKEYKILEANSYIQEVQLDLNYNAMFKYNSSHIKQKTVEDFNISFNPNSSAHKCLLFYDTWGYDILETTKTGNPSVGKDVVKEYLLMEQDDEKKEVLEALLEIAAAAKVQSSFINGIRKLVVEDDLGYMRLHADFKLTGTVSGRLSSANPNLQNLPSGSKYGKLVKSFFTPPAGYIFAGSDFNALEDRVGAEETRDAAKVKIMLDGYDSHSLNTASYFADELKERGLPYGKDITVEESFIIKEKAGDLRQASKAITFGLIYGGTEHTVQKSLGCTKEKAIEIVEAYHELYSGVQKYYDKYVNEALANNCRVMTPHGLLIRAPELNAGEQHIAEGAERSVCNALIQGLSGQLMIKVLNRLQDAIEANSWDDDVQIFLTIHDSLYLYVKEDVELIAEVNKLVIDTMIEDYRPDQLVHNKANLDIGYDWSDQREVPNNASVEEIKEILYEEKE